MTDTKQLEEIFSQILTIDDWVYEHCPFPESSISFENTKSLRIKDLKATLIELITAAETAARLSELEMFKKIEVMDMSIPVAAHISRRYKHLQKGNR